jgi:uncharacterized protein (TIGR03435 family)
MRPPSLTLTAKTVLATALLIIGCNAQPAPQPEFEVASIKLTINNRQPGTGQLRMGPQISGNTAEYVYMTLRQLIAEAYNVKPFQVDCPDWCVQERFDVMAKMPAGSRKEDASPMLQSLLKERFKLAVHRESRAENVSALVIYHGGPKLTESAPRRSATVPFDRLGIAARFRYG